MAADDTLEGWRLSRHTFVPGRCLVQACATPRSVVMCLLQPSPHDANTVADHELISREAWPSYFAPVIDFETRAVRIHEWELRVIPGLLQTESYARSVISAGKPRLGLDALDRLVTSRIERRH